MGKSEEELRQRHYGHKKEIDLKSTMLGKHFAEKCGYGFFQIQASSGLSDTLESYVMAFYFSMLKHKIISRHGINTSYHKPKELKYNSKRIGSVH